MSNNLASACRLAGYGYSFRGVGVAGLVAGGVHHANATVVVSAFDRNGKDRGPGRFAKLLFFLGAPGQNHPPSPTSNVADRSVSRGSTVGRKAPVVRYRPALDLQMTWISL